MEADKGCRKDYWESGLQQECRAAACQDCMSRRCRRRKEGAGKSGEDGGEDMSDGWWPRVMGYGVKMQGGVGWWTFDTRGRSIHDMATTALQQMGKEQSNASCLLKF